MTTSQRGLIGPNSLTPVRRCTDRDRTIDTSRNDASNPFHRRAIGRHPRGPVLAGSSSSRSGAAPPECRGVSSVASLSKSTLGVLTNSQTCTWRTVSTTVTVRPPSSYSPPNHHPTLVPSPIFCRRLSQKKVDRLVFRGDRLSLILSSRR